MNELYIASILLFLLTVLSLYALIVSRRHYFVLAFLIPIALTASTYTGYVVYSMRGTPIINALPENVTLDVLFVQPAKPWIYLLIKTRETPQPEFHKIDYTDNNLKQLKQALALQQRGEKSEQQGEFKKQGQNDSNSTEFIFIDSSRAHLPSKIDS